jgi:hypothetical protein
MIFLSTLFSNTLSLVSGRRHAPATPPPPPRKEPR